MHTLMMNAVNDKQKQSKMALILSMVIFGTIGVFRKYIPLPSSVLALVRGFIGMLFLLLLIGIKGEKLDFNGIKKNLVFLCLSGAMLGFNWILLFEAYQYTSVAVATLCYYMAPIFVILVSPILLKEQLSLKKILCIISALIGMSLVSGVLEVGVLADSEMKGILLGLSAAVFYAGVILTNKKVTGLSAYDKTIMQLGVSVMVLLPYTLLNKSYAHMTFSALSITMLMVVGIVHTGVAYALYFGSMKALKAQTIALFSYIDPIVAIMLSTLFLHERMGFMEMIGSILVLGSTFISELPEKSKA